MCFVDVPHLAEINDSWTLLAILMFVVKLSVSKILLLVDIFSNRLLTARPKGGSGGSTLTLTPTLSLSTTFRTVPMHPLSRP